MKTASNHSESKIIKSDPYLNKQEIKEEKIGKFEKPLKLMKKESNQSESKIIKSEPYLNENEIQNMNKEKKIEPNTQFILKNQENQ